MTKATGAPGTEVEAERLVTAWERVASWLRTHSPTDHAALRDPASEEEITALETRLGFPLHPQLRSLLRLHDGVIRTPEREVHHAGAFLPLGHRLATTALIADHHESLRQVGEIWREAGLAEDEDELLGHTHQWVEFAYPNDGGIAFVDHRPGPTYGQVYEMGIGSGAGEATKWACDLAELFDEMADSLESRSVFLHHWVPTPYELGKETFCVGWSSGEPTGADGTPDWPRPRLPVPPVRPERRRGLGAGLTRLLVPALPMLPMPGTDGSPVNHFPSPRAQRAPMHSPGSLRAPGRSGE